MTPSGVPPIPNNRSTSVRGVAATIAPATSPSVIRKTRAPASRISRDQAVVARSREDR